MCAMARSHGANSLFFAAFFSLKLRPTPISTLFPYTTLFRSGVAANVVGDVDIRDRHTFVDVPARSEEHTSELQSRLHLVCRLLLEKKKAQKFGRSYEHAGCAIDPNRTSRTRSLWRTLRLPLT